VQREAGHHEGIAHVGAGQEARAALVQDADAALAVGVATGHLLEHLGRQPREVAVLGLPEVEQHRRHVLHLGPRHLGRGRLRPDPLLEHDERRAVPDAVLRAASGELGQARVVEVLPGPQHEARVGLAGEGRVGGQRRRGEAVEVLDRRLPRCDDVLDPDRIRHVAHAAHVVRLRGRDERIVDVELQARVDLEEVIAGLLLLEHDRLGLRRIGEHRAARPHRRVAVDDRARGDDRGAEQLARLDLPAPHELHLAAEHVAHRRHAVGEEQREVVRAPGVDVHVRQARHEPAAVAVDARRTLGHRSVGFAGPSATMRSPRTTTVWSASTVFELIGTTLTPTKATDGSSGRRAAGSAAGEPSARVKAK
jgi:hypothetical protein